jgi:tetratricopeptide (TPR) repeat protein
LEVVQDLDQFDEEPPLPEYETDERVKVQIDGVTAVPQTEETPVEESPPQARAASGEARRLETKGIKSAGRRKRAGVIRSAVRVTSHLEEAESLYKDKKYADAAKVLKMALRKEPNNGDYHCLLGLCQTHMEFFQDEAERHLRRAIELNPWTSDPVYALGVLFRNQGKERQAAKCFERVMSMTANHHRAVAAMRANIKKHQKGGLFSIKKKDLKSR